MSASGESGQPLSPVGAEVARLFSGRKTQWSTPTPLARGSPRRRLIVLMPITAPACLGFRPRSAWSPTSSTHLLQRDLKPKQYWPSGGCASFSRRGWATLTSFMEVVAYLVGWTVEYDLTAARAQTYPPASLRQRSSRARRAA
jgi:hypothetical protein